ncbi:putative lysosomal Pro-Xaa carboxypeptidase [Rosa chinensis]|uniref:Putative lysosomal Pro-Xaa carboxypeptidase n=1 Tax=Rosa chinensis TaxID=74649 RepID=A0A2P6RPI0_ROSCH|nr:lysosomal Pro-X carboxypeptidase [Rosa chinensis]PRQ48301.1 putative lysosomal Pro-Xaa carboxypeptidase [Rosa chinensis]
MAKPKYSHLSLIHLIISIIITSSLPSLASNRPPRFLGKFSRSSPPNSPSPLERRQQQKKLIQYETRYFSQNLDHFSFSETPKFQQRYLVNAEHWVGPLRQGPIFLYCGNEGDIVWFAENTGFVWELAPRFGAMVLFPEHRYYGESMPYGSEEEAYKNATTLSFLTAEQALADFAVLITELKRDWSAEGCPVLLFGGSYGGMLAAWMRLKYPHIAIGALASSAPILQFEDIVPTETFYDIVSSDFRRESSSCFNTIKESWDALMTEGQKQNGLHQLTKTFHLCGELKRTEDLVDWLESAYSYLAMVNYPYGSEFMMPLPGHPIREVCRKIDGCPDGTSTLERIFEGISVYHNYSGKADCFELEDESDVGTDGWNWQACTEMVMPMSSSRDRSMFQTYDYNFSSFQEWCWKQFNVKPRPTWITTEFGGHDIKATLKNVGSNIIFSNGLLDPWSGGSVLQNVSESIVALVTEEGAHHIDLRFSTKGDPEWLVEQRESEIKLIQGWLDHFYQEKKAAFDM